MLVLKKGRERERKKTNWYITASKQYENEWPSTRL